jgi:hypothetical protein
VALNNEQHARLWHYAEAWAFRFDSMQNRATPIAMFLMLCDVIEDMKSLENPNDDTKRA